MYYIYEIVGVKIGCTQDIERRQKEQLSKGEMVLLETYTDIEEASRRERELQLEKGYSVDSHQYNSWMNTFHLKSREKKVRKKAMNSIDWKSRNRKLSEYAKSGKLNNNKHTSKRVAQFTKDGKYIKTYPSIMEAKRQTGICVSYAIHSGGKTAGGYVWKYA